MNKLLILQETLSQTFDLESIIEYKELTIIANIDNCLDILTVLKEDKKFEFNQLIDLAGADYLEYGKYDWETKSATQQGFSRGVDAQPVAAHFWDKPRFAIIYHLLSTTKNHRLRVKVFLPENALAIQSVHTIWPSANWYEREAYDLYGILFIDHPDLRRILTDYGFIGYPFRKDFPLSGHVEMQYDAASGRVIYKPVDIKPRINIPKVIREDNRYSVSEENDD